jgi:hypothetical protein
MKAANATVMAISHGFTLGFQPTWGAGAGFSMCLAGAGDEGCDSDNSFLLCWFARV